MGLVITNNLITVDHSVKDHLVTTVEGNPKNTTLHCGLRVTSIFSRRKDSGKVRRRRNERQIGDNCPLLYALKQKEGLATNITSVKRLWQNAQCILRHVAKQTKADIVVYMPSAYSLSRIVAKRCSKAFQADMIEGIFHKITKLEAYEMLRRAEQNGDIEFADKKRLDFALKQSDGFSLKVIPPRFRALFTPLRLDPAFSTSLHGRIVLVDDLLASGRTLSVASTIIRSMPGVTSVEAVCLFSDI